jgi:hypothetical protein
VSKYLLIYHGGGSPQTDAEREAVTAAWTQWFTELGSATVDRGNPTSHARMVASDGSASNGGGANPATGYSIIEVDSIDNAVKAAGMCPHLASGGSVEVAEIYEVM